MKIHNTFFLIALIALLAACQSNKQITNSINAGESAYQSGDYSDALVKFEEVISQYENKDQQKECPVYAEAGHAALQLGETTKAIQYFQQDQWSNFVDADTYFQLAKLYRTIDNLSKELDALEAYTTKYREGKNIDEVKGRLFEVYVESENWEKAIVLWDKLAGDQHKEITMLEGYFSANKALKNETVCDTLATYLVDYDENNLIGLRYLAKKYFWQAENLYQSELKAYEANKTNKQYKKLLKALDTVTADFKISLGYYKRLYTLQPNPVTAKRLANIYTRLDDKKRAAYYTKLAIEVD